LSSILVVEGYTSLGGLETFFLDFAICVLRFNLQAVRLQMKVPPLIPIVGNTERGVESIFPFPTIVLPVKTYIFITQDE